MALLNRSSTSLADSTAAELELPRREPDVPPGALSLPLADGAAIELERPRRETSSPSPALPRHVAIIMDGNGRWAHKHGLPRVEGHRRGVEALRRAVRFAVRRGVRYLTLFSFSSENWSRPDDEIEGLFNLVRIFIRGDLAELNKNGVKIRVIGERDPLPSDIRALIEETERVTLGNRGLNLTVAFNYGSRDEIVRAARDLAKRAVRGEIEPGAIDHASFEQGLDTVGIPDPDLIVRTSGEQRISNFLLWQAAYAELVFSQVLWPDFGDADFEAALAEYSSRERRYGGIVGA
jgi:undecaprenyl diphosphate synthase